MKTKRGILRRIACGIRALLFVLPAGWVLAQSEVHVVVIGDTTAANHSNPALGWGWGQYLEAQLGNAKVTNHAAAGKSTKTFLESPAWQKALSTPADYWLIQFGANDGRKTDPRFTDPSTDFKDNLRRMITECRGLNAKPILVTPTQILGRDRKTPSAGLAPYVIAIREVAEEEKVPFIDLYDWTGEWYKEIGEGNLDSIFVEQSTAYYNADGARQIARYIANKLVDIAPQLRLAGADSQ